MIADVIVIGIIILGVLGVTFYRIKRKKSGKSGCGCGCAGCTSTCVKPSEKE